MEYVESGRCNKKIENLREALADLEEELERLHKSLRRESRQKKPKTSLIDSIKRQIERKQRQINGVRHKINMQYEIINTATDRLTDAKKKGNWRTIPYQSKSRTDRLTHQNPL